MQQLRELNKKFIKTNNRRYSNVKKKKNIICTHEYYVIYSDEKMSGYLIENNKEKTFMINMKKVDNKKIYNEGFHQ